MPIYVKNSDVWVPSKYIHVKQDNIWKQSNNVYIKDGGAWKLVYSIYNITANSYDVNLYTAMGSPIYPLTAVVNISNNVIVSGTNTNNAALDIGSFPVGSLIYLNVGSGAYIVGRGGNGGYGANSEGWAGTGLVGAAGGTGLKTTLPITLVNNGTIAGGGGGGGGGGGRVIYHGAGNGGGGAGGYHYATTSAAIGLSPGTNVAIPAGYGGIGAGPRCDRNCSARAGDGTLTTGGLGTSGSEGGTSRMGGNGGSLGTAGLSGTGYAGGAAGKSIDGTSYITKLVTGTILGPQI
jgi:hypothetical protein